MSNNLYCWLHGCVVLFMVLHFRCGDVVSTKQITIAHDDVRSCGLGTNRTSSVCYNIVVVSPPFSPIQSALSVGVALKGRGHTVTLISHETVRDKADAVNIPLVSAGKGYTKEELKEFFDKIHSLPSMQIPLTAMKLFGSIINELMQTLQDHVMTTNRSSFTKHVDVIVVDALGDTEVLRRLGIPFLHLTPTLAVPPIFASMPYVPMVPFNFYRRRLPTVRGTSWTATDALYDRFNDQNNMNRFRQRFFDRLQTFLVLIFFHYVVSFGIRNFAPTSPFRYLFQKRGLTLVASAPGFDYPVHVPPLVRYVGPIVNEYRMDPNQIDTDLRSWMENSQRSELPIIYMSLGTVVQLNSKIAAFLYETTKPDTIHPRWRVIWSVPEIQWDALPHQIYPSLNNTTNIDNNSLFKIVAWTSSPAVLSHSLVDLFISHCGGNGVHESLLTGTPIIGIPFYGDQHAVCDRVQWADVGITFPHFRNAMMRDENSDTSSLFSKVMEWLTGKVYTIDSSVMRAAIEEVLFTNHDIYLEKTRQIRGLMRIHGGVQAASDWIELTASMNGSALESWLETPVENSGIIVAYSIDIGVILVALCVLVLAACVSSCVCVFRRIFKRVAIAHQEPEKSEKTITPMTDDEEAEDLTKKDMMDLSATKLSLMTAEIRRRNQSNPPLFT